MELLSCFTISLGQKLKLSDDGHVGVELVMNHEAKDAHHSCAAVVDLDRALPLLGSIIELVPTKINETVAEIALELGLPARTNTDGLGLVAVGGLHQGDGGNDLRPDHAGHCVEGSESTGDVLGAREANAGGCLRRKGKTRCDVLETVTG